MKLFIFGSTGDLFKRKVLPALQTLSLKSFKDLEIYTLGRKDFTQEIYREFVCGKNGCIPSFRKILDYHQLDFTDPNLLAPASNHFDKTEKNHIYISLPPALIKKVLIALGDLIKQGFTFSILIEKPFGENLADALNLKKIIDEHNLHGAVFLSDHYLFKKEVLSLKPVNFKKIKLVSVEEIGLEGRASYYDSVGALKDMVQSHFLNIIFKLLPNPAKEFSNFTISGYKRGQYTGYDKELGKKSDTETFVDVSLKTKNREFEFITGKAFDKKSSFIEIDNKKIKIDFSTNAYIKLFTDFLKNKDEEFPTIDNSILAWKIIEKIEKEMTPLTFYPKGSTTYLKN